MEKKIRDNVSRGEQENSDLIRSVVSVRRVSTVRQGGKKFSFTALVVMGDGQGRAGYGAGKAKEIPEAVRKAMDEASRSMCSISLKEGRTIHHDCTASFGAGLVHLRSAPAGTGIISGGAMRSVFEAIGIHDIVSKSLRSSNPYNMVKATFKALMSIRSVRYIAQKRGKKPSEIIGHEVKLEKGAI